MGLVADVDRDQQRRQLLDDPRRLQRPGVDRAQAGDQLDQPRDPRLVGLAVAADEHVLVELVRRGRRGVGAPTVCSAATTVTPSGTISWACCAAEPCQTPSVRVALPLTAAASGTVQSTRIWPGAQRLAQVVEVLRLGAEGDGQEDDLAALRGVAVGEPLDRGAGDGLAQLRRRLLGALGRARADHDRPPGLRPAQRQPGAEGAGAADDRDRFELTHSAAQSMLTRVSARSKLPVVDGLPGSVRIREVGPRDGFQNEPETIPTAEKVRLVDLLSASGLGRIELTSFVRPDVIPQLSDAERGAAARCSGARASPSRC